MNDDDIPLDPSTLIRLGVISAVTLDPPRCRVRFGDPDADDGAIESPPIRWLALRAGATRRWSAPTVGEECVLICPDGQIGNGVALTGLYNDNHPAPANTLAELIAYPDGAILSYDPESHHLSAILPDGGSVQITAPGGVKIIGTLLVDGSIAASGNLSSGTGATGVFSASGKTINVVSGIITNIN
ncbi:phage baseplate assembly protein V [Novosphingobium humi]|uniref:Phage baseplate assembly protein V n=1 Tax=Novosphingobium humi TaxID=2282397 RepID=A0ABY7TTF7_9SPHN|nr:phage baseplate assembly protein V [Novosphingobium humi]WCT76298.1 phage baseplate assembly protein V [Novosphingobium humi]WJS97239.1 phage baseplate assembly protein V [Novosphingobium humi]